MIQTAEGALNETHEILQRMRELSVQAANDTNVEADRAAITEELTALFTEVTRIAGSTEFNTKNLIGSAATAVLLHIGSNESQNLTVTFTDMRASATTLALVSSAATGISAIQVSAGNSVANALITTVNNALTNVSTERAKLGAIQNRLEHTIKNLDTGAENLQASESRIRDVDMAKEMMNFTKQMILNQAAQAMLAQANQAPQGVLQLLK